MNGIKYHAQMSLAEERRLFAAIKRSQRVRRRLARWGTVVTNRSISHYWLQTQWKVMEDYSTLKGGSEAETRIVTEHLALVNEIARRLFRKNRLFLVDINDLFSAGEEGLMIALRRFSGARHKQSRTRFATYAAWWIMHAVSKAVRDQRWMIGIPNLMHRRVVKLVKESAKLQNVLGRSPSIEELMGSLDLPEHVVKQLIAWASPQCISLDTPVGEEGKSKLKDFIEDRSISPPNMSAELTLIHEGFGRMLAALSERERLIIEGRFGLDGKGQRTQEELANQLSVTRQAISAMEERALQQIREAMGVRVMRQSYQRRALIPDVKVRKSLRASTKRLLAAFALKRSSSMPLERRR